MGRIPTSTSAEGRRLHSPAQIPTKSISISAAASNDMGFQWPENQTPRSGLYVESDTIPGTAAPTSKALMFLGRCDDLDVEGATSPGVMDYRSFRLLDAILGCEQQAPGGRRATQPESWKRPIRLS